MDQNPKEERDLKLETTLAPTNDINSNNDDDSKSIILNVFDSDSTSTLVNNNNNNNDGEEFKEITSEISFSATDFKVDPDNIEIFFDDDFVVIPDSPDEIKVAININNEEGSVDTRNLRISSFSDEDKSTESELNRKFEALNRSEEKNNDERDDGSSTVEQNDAARINETLGNRDEAEDQVSFWLLI